MFLREKVLKISLVIFCSSFLLASTAGAQSPGKVCCANQNQSDDTIYWVWTTNTSCPKTSCQKKSMTASSDCNAATSNYNTPKTAVDPGDCSGAAHCAGS